MIADLAKRDFNFIVFAGAGIPHESKPPITWKQLLAAFKKEEPELAAREIDKVGEDEYPDYAQEIFDTLRKMGRESRYYEILGKILEATHSLYSGEQRDIIETAKHVVTTNFDDSFKRGLERELEGDGTSTFKVQELPDLRIKALYNNYSVSYLHGRTCKECIVFKKDDYEIFYPSQRENNIGNDNLEQFLRYLYEEQTMVFIGVSFNDKYLLNALNRIYKRVKQNDEVGREKKVRYKSKLDNIQHYAFMPQNMGIKAKERRREKDDSISEQQIEKERNSKREIFAELRIKIVSYQNYKDWISWLSAIREGSRKLKRGKRGVFSIIEYPGRVGIKDV